MRNQYNLAISITGPDTGAIDLLLLSNKLENIVLIGDGATDIMDGHEEGALVDILHNLSQNHPKLLQAKAFIYINMHGAMVDEQLYLLAKDEGSPLSSKKLFKILNDTIGRPMDIIFIPCNGKGALKDVEELPKGSKIIFISETDGLTTSSRPAIILEQMANIDDFTIDTFYDHYLASMHSNENPIMVVAGEKIIDPFNLSSTYLGKYITALSREYVHSNFGKNICQSSSLCHNYVDYLMDEMETVSSMEKFSTESRNFAKLIDSLVLVREQWNTKLANYSRTLKDSCLVDFSKMKDDIDQLLTMQKIALELDLSKELIWQEYNPYFKYHANANIFYSPKDSILSLGFTPNGEFANSEYYAEYGMVLGIVKDIYLSLNLSMHP